MNFEGDLTRSLDIRGGDEMAKMAIVDPTAGGNPRALTEADARDLYERALEGRLG